MSFILPSLAKSRRQEARADRLAVRDTQDRQDALSAHIKIGIHNARARGQRFPGSLWPPARKRARGTDQQIYEHLMQGPPPGTRLITHVLATHKGFAARLEALADLDVPERHSSVALPPKATRTAIPPPPEQAPNLAAPSNANDTLC